ncbi:hypothetical protein TWF694_009411 [Orbilia ellipsospora]|uniref:Uncharacterized protein n=1 Tax=Orbilia ellipsospora TaxID=2528407 RepID=A0AAV9XDS4_9PEZI
MFSTLTSASLVAVFALLNNVNACSSHSSSTLTTYGAGYYYNTTTTASTSTTLDIYGGGSSTTTTVPYVNAYGTGTTLSSTTRCTESTAAPYGGSTEYGTPGAYGTPGTYGTPGANGTPGAYGTGTTKSTIPAVYGTKSTTLAGYGGSQQYTTAAPAKYSTSVYSAQYGSVKTIETCTTEYCGVQVAPIPTNVATVHTASIASVYQTSTSTCLVTLKGETKSLTKTVTKTCTSTGKASVHTVYATHVVKVTVDHPIYYTKTYTTSLAPKTIKGSATTVPTPYGFVNVADDSANAPSKYSKRDGYEYAAPAPAPAPATTRYVTAVVCTKTLATVSTHTYTVIATAKASSTVYGKTVTITHTSSVTQTVAPAYAQTTTITRIATSTITTTCTRTAYTTVTKQSTAVMPGATTYAACNARNVYSGPSGSVTANVGTESQTVPGVSTPQECCARCQAHVGSYGAKDCAGSYFTSDEGTNTCVLRLTTTCSNSNYGTFTTTTHNDYSDYSQGYVSNGPCGRWKVSPSNSGTPSGTY